MSSRALGFCVMGSGRTEAGEASSRVQGEAPSRSLEASQATGISFAQAAASSSPACVPSCPAVPFPSGACLSGAWFLGFSRKQREPHITSSLHTKGRRHLNTLLGADLSGKLLSEQPSSHLASISSQSCGPLPGCVPSACSSCSPDLGG